MANNKLLYSIANTVKTFEILILGIVFSRLLLDKVELGKLFQILLVSSIIVTFCSGIPLSMNFFFGKYKSQKKEVNSLFTRFLVSIIIATLIILVVILLLVSEISRNFENDFFLKYTGAIISFFFLKSINAYFPNYHFLNNQLKKYLIVFTSSAIVLFGLIFFRGFIPDVYLVYYFILSLLAIEVIRCICNMALMNWSEMFFKDFLLKQSEAKYLLTISGVVILGAINLYIDRYLISSMLDPAEFAMYQNGAINLPFVNIITSSLFISSIPFFTELYLNKEIKKLLNYTKDIITKCSLLLVPILIYCFFEGVSLITFLYGSDFVRSGEVFQIYILRYLFSIMAYSVFMGCIGLEKKSIYVILLSALIGTGLNLLFIPVYSIIGAAWAIVIASNATIIISIILINLKLKTSLAYYFPIKNYLIILMGSILLYTPFYIINHILFDFNGLVIISSVLYYLILILLLNSYLKIFDLKQLFSKLGI